MSDLDVLRDLTGEFRPPPYDDLVAVSRTRRSRAAAAAGAAAAVVVVVVAVTAAGLTHVTRADRAPVAPPPSRTETPKSQSPETWADTPLVAGHDGSSWVVPDPLTPVRDAWFDIVADHLDATEERLISRGAGSFERPGEDSIYSTSGEVGLIVDRSALNLFDDGCRYLTTPPADNGIESCSTERIAGPDGERVRISRYQRLCESWDPGSEGDDARPGPGETYLTCGDYVVAVAVERRDDLVGFVRVGGRGTPDLNPFDPADLVAVAADRRLRLPEVSYGVPSDPVVATVLEEHVPGLVSEDQGAGVPEHPGYGFAYGRLGRLRVSMAVWPAGGDPDCGRSQLVECVERRVFGADDPTTVFVGAWDVEDPAFCCPREYPKRQLVYVGPRHTVVVWASKTVRGDQEPINAGVDQRLIDLALDPLLQ